MVQEKGFTDDTHWREKHDVYDKQIAHLHKAKDRARSGERKPRGRSTSKGRPVDHDHDKQKGKKFKKGDKKPFIEEAPNSIFGMLPCSSFFPAAMQKIAVSYGEYYDMSDEIKSMTCYSYEAYSEDRYPHAFYVSQDEHKQTNRVYSAYVSEKEYLTVDRLVLASSLSTYQDQNPKSSIGAIYYNAVKQYKQDGVYKEGFISFFIPFKRVMGEKVSDDRVVCWVQPYHDTGIAEGTMPKTKENFYHFFKKYIVATNIPMKSSGVEMDEKEIESIVNHIRGLCDKPTRLYRSSRSFSIQKNVNANVYKTETFKVKSTNKNLTAHVQMVVPYTSNKAITARKIITFVISKCIKKVKESDYLKAISLDHQGKPGGNPSPQELFKRLWLCSAWVLSTEMCRALMDSVRISKLTDRIFFTFEQVYLSDHAWPTEGAWKKIKEENSGLVLPPRVLHTHFAGKTDSIYGDAVFDKDSDEARSGTSTPFNFKNVPGGDDVGMPDKSTTALRPWDTPTETTPIDNWEEGTPGRAKQKNTKFQKFKPCEPEMVFVALFMRNLHLGRVKKENPVLQLPKTKKLYEYILKEYKEYIENNRPADSYNHPSGITKDLYSHTLDYRWQYTVMTCINDFSKIGERREQQDITNAWIDYLREVKKVFGGYVEKEPAGIESIITKTGEFWAFDPVKEAVVFVAKLMKNIYLNEVNVVNTSFALFGLSKTNLLYNMITQFYENEVVVDQSQVNYQKIKPTNDRPGRLSEFLKHSLDYRWQWAVMKTINKDSESREDRFKLKTRSAWTDYLKTAYTYANRVPDEFQEFSKCEKEMVFVAEFMKIKVKVDGHGFRKPKYYEAVDGIKEISNIYSMLYRSYYFNLLWERPRPNITNHTLQYTWQYALMKTIEVLSLDPEKQKQFWFSILQKAYQIAHPSAILTAPAKAGGPGPAGGNGDPTAPAKVAEPVVEAPAAVDESPIQAIAEFQKFKEYKAEMIFVADLMKKIHSKAVHINNTAFALFGLSKTNLLYNMINYEFYGEDVEENPIGTRELYKHSLDYRWQWAVMKTINQSGEDFVKWIEYLQTSYKYVNHVQDDFRMFVDYEEQVAFVAKFVARMFSSNQKPKTDDPLLLLSSTTELFEWIKANIMSLIWQKKIGLVTNYTLDYTWQYALMLAMIMLTKIYGEKMNEKFWTDYLQKAYELSQTPATPTAPVIDEPPAPASGNGGPNPPGNGGGPPSGEQSGSATSGSDRPQSARSNRKVKETEGPEKARVNRIRDPVIKTGKTRDEQLKKLREIGETGGGAEDDAGQTTTSTPATSEPSTPRSGAAGGGAGGKLVEEKTPRSKPYDKIATAGGNEGPAAPLPKLPLPAQREVSPPASEVSDEDSDEEQSDSEGGGQDIGTAPDTPADTNFTPENTPPPDQKAGGGRPQSAPQSRAVKEKTKSAEDLRNERLGQAVQNTGRKREEKYKSSREIGTVAKDDAGQKPPTESTPTSEPSTPKSDDAGGEVQEIETTPSTPADTILPEATPPRRPETAPQSRAVKEKNKSAEDLRNERLGQAVQNTGRKREEKYKSSREIGTVAKDDAGQKPPTESTPTSEPSTPTGTPRASKHPTKKETRQTETLRFKPEKLISKPKNEEEINVWRKRALDKIKKEIILLGKRPGQGVTDAPDKSRKMLPEEDKRTIMYEDKYKQWIPYRKKIMTLARYMDLLINDPRHHFEEGKVQEILNTNLLTAKLYGLLELSLLDDAQPYDELMQIFSLSNSLTQEYIILHAMNNDEKAWEEWKNFLDKIKENVDDQEELVAMELGSKLHTFPADVSPLIYDLTRRLEALQAW